MKPQSSLSQGLSTKKEKVEGSLQKVPEDKAEEQKENPQTSKTFFLY